MARGIKSITGDKADEGEGTQKEGKKNKFQNEWLEGKSNDPSGVHMRCGSVLIINFEF